MSLTERISADVISAMKSKSEPELSVLRLVRAAFKNKEIDLGHPLNDDEAMAVIKTMVKQGNDAMKDFIADNRQDLVDKQTQETEILERYLPKPLPAEEIQKICEQAVADSGATGVQDMGKVMGVAMKLIAGRASGDVVKESIQKLLTK
ncbi:GatB/YqeY domain-containing protein [Patescibacteria group bacterium]|nr:GatB/YqeY domain-containing protein [Patescibacteria group bacterium]